MFGKDPILPVHEEDAQLPLFLRTRDINSTTTLPRKKSMYLSTVDLFNGGETLF